MSDIIRPRPAFLSLMAIGDAFGMKYEFVTHDQSAGQADLSYGPNPNFMAYQAGEYTDDTQMSLANAEFLLTHFRNAARYKDDDLINGWLQTFKRDPRLGYSQTMYKVLAESETPDDFRALINPDMGVTSCAAMRAGVFGLMPFTDELVRLTKQQARITHNTQAGINAALAAAITVHHLHYTHGARERLSGALDYELGAGWDSEASGLTDSPNNGLKIVKQALHALGDSKTYSEVLLRAVNQSPHADTDTICALAMLFASRCPDIVDDLPETLYTELGGGQYGLDYLVRTDAALMACFPA